MTAITIQLDDHRGIASKKATKARRLLAGVDHARAAFKAYNESRAALATTDKDDVPKS